jgi:kinetochore protein Mis13/DSN1
VEKKRGPTKIALPFADTPVIMRNKEMRKTSADGRRRSSSIMRGRRASSLIDSGTSNGELDATAPDSNNEAEGYLALPHSEVETADFYKHIHQDLTEPRRMRQLLVWCGTRALPERPSGSAEDVNAILAGSYSGFVWMNYYV